MNSTVLLSSSPRVAARVAAWRARLQTVSVSSPDAGRRHGVMLPIVSATPQRQRLVLRGAATTTSGAAATTTTTTQTPAFPHPITYHPDFNINPVPDGHKFPMPKDALLYNRLVAENGGGRGGVSGNTTTTRPPPLPRVFEPAPATRAELLLAHDADYVDAFLAGTLPLKQMRRIGLPWSPELVRRTLVGVGSCVLAARLATQLGLAITTNGGTHHAHKAHGSGFCIFNDLAVAARKAQEDGLAGRVFFCDLDVHQGDGTAAIFAGDSSAFTFSVHCGEQTFPEQVPGDMDVPLAAGTGDDAYMEALSDALPKAWEAFCAAGAASDASSGSASSSLALYNAGVDVHADDDLGKLALTDEGVARRDAFVLDFFASRGVPLCAAIGGGYNLRDHAAIVSRHMNLHRAAAAHFPRFAAVADARRF
jgi:acetoin utilization deacetylase AcuC-like enzyme